MLHTINGRLMKITQYVSLMARWGLDIFKLILSLNDRQRLSPACLRCVATRWRSSHVIVIDNLVSKIVSIGIPTPFAIINMSRLFPNLALGRIIECLRYDGFRGSSKRPARDSITQ
jgi:hypothetical protein